MTPDFGPGDYGQDDDRPGDDLRAQARHVRRLAGQDAREMRETGTDAAGERDARWAALAAMSDRGQQITGDVRR